MEKKMIIPSGAMPDAAKVITKAADLYPLSKFPPLVGDPPGQYGKNPHDSFDNLLMGSFRDK